MADIKSRERFFEPDPVSQSLAPSLEVQYEHLLKYCGLHDGAPEAVRSYFNTVLTLWLYGWLYYPFYTLAAFLSTFVIEMALRERFPPKKLNKWGRDPRFLGDLLREAKDAGLLRDEGFPGLENRRVNAAEMRQEMPGILGRDPEPEPEVAYVDVLIQTLPYLRNRFAHPDIHSILPPGPALDSLIVAAEIVNQLWPKPPSGQTPRSSQQESSVSRTSQPGHVSPKMLAHYSHVRMETKRKVLDALSSRGLRRV